MDARRAADRLESRVLEILHHDAVIVRTIPCLRIVRVGVKMLPQRSRRRFARRRRHGVMEHDIAVLLPAGEIGGAQHRRARLHCGEPARGLLRDGVTRDRGIDARDPLRRDAAGGGDDPALELVETRGLLAEKACGLFEAEPAGVDDEIVEVAVVQGRRPALSAAGGHAARPQPLELINAERAGLGRRRQRGAGGTSASVMRSINCQDAAGGIKSEQCSAVNAAPSAPPPRSTTRRQLHVKAIHMTGRTHEAGVATARLSPRQSARGAGAAALELIAEKGPAGFTFAEAARWAGVSPAAPYRHFRDRDDAARRGGAARLRAVQRALTAAWDEGRPDALVRASTAGPGLSRLRARASRPITPRCSRPALPLDADPGLRGRRRSRFRRAARRRRNVCAAMPPRAGRRR